MRILVALDLSHVSEPLMRYAVDLSRATDDLLIVHTYDPDEAAAALEEAGLYLDRYLDHLRGEVNYLLTKTGAARHQIRVSLVEGNPVEAILGTARRDHADLIVMGTHGRTGIQRLLMGSVAEGVLRHAPCPVVVVPYAILLAAAREPAVSASA